MDAFIQCSVLLPQGVQLNTCEEYGKYSSNNDTEVRVSQFYDDHQFFDSSIESYASSSMIDNIMAVVAWRGAAEVLTYGDYWSCLSGLSRFGVYQTLGVSAECIDRSQDIVLVGQNKEFLALPGADGLQLLNSTGHVAVKSYKTSSNATTASQPGPLIARTAIIFNTLDNDTALAMECSLYWGIKTMTAYANRSSYGNLHEDELNDHRITRFEAGDGSQDFWLAYRLWPGKECYYDNEIVSRNEDPESYHKNCEDGIGAHKGLQRSIMVDQDGFHGISELIGNNTATNETKYSRTNSYVNHIYDSGISEESNFEPLPRKSNKREVENIHTTLALFMTKHMRKSGYVLGGDNNDEQYDGFVISAMYEMVLYYKIAWVRLNYPAIIVVASALIVLLTALKTKRDLQWRRSNIPMMFHGLSEKERDLCRFEPDLLKMENAASNMQVKLVDGHECVRLTRFPRPESLDGMSLRSRTLVA